MHLNSNMSACEQARVSQFDSSAHGSFLRAKFQFARATIPAWSEACFKPNRQVNFKIGHIEWKVDCYAHNMLPKLLVFLKKLTFWAPQKFWSILCPKSRGFVGMGERFFCYMPMTRNFNMCMKKQKLHRLCSKKILRIRRKRRQKEHGCADFLCKSGK